MRNARRARKAASRLASGVLAVCLLAGLAAAFGCAYLWDRLNVAERTNRNLRAEAATQPAEDAQPLQTLQASLKTLQQQNRQLDGRLQQLLVERQQWLAMNQQPAADQPTTDQQGEPASRAAAEPSGQPSAQTMADSERMQMLESENARLQDRLQRLVEQFDELILQRERLRADNAELRDRIADLAEADRGERPRTVGRQQPRSSPPSSSRSVVRRSPDAEPPPPEDDGWRPVKP